VTLALLAISGIVGPALPDGVRGTDRPATFDPPETILDGTEYAGRLFPHFADFDGDGTTDLLVGVWDRMLVYRNRGTEGQPEYAKPTWLDESEPSARIPSG
jgi:hypothetical protein